MSCRYSIVKMYQNLPNQFPVNKCSFFFFPHAFFKLRYRGNQRKQVRLTLLTAVYLLKMFYKISLGVHLQEMWVL